MNEQEMALFKSTLDTLKDIASYLEKSEDIEKQLGIQERAKIDKPPKAQEYNEEIVGGPAATNKPGEGVAKSYINIPENPKKNAQEEISDRGSTMVKAKGKEDEVEEVSDEESSEPSDTSEASEPSDTQELKSLLKDIRDTLASQPDAATIAKAILASDQFKKSINTATDDRISKMLRKQGFVATHPDVVKIPSTGVDTNAEVKKSENSAEEVKPDISKSDDEAIADAINTNRSFGELGKLREKLGLFKAFDS